MAEESDLALNEGAEEQGGGENVEEEEKEVAVDELTKIFNNYESDVKVSKASPNPEHSEGKERKDITSYLDELSHERD